MSSQLNETIQFIPLTQKDFPLLLKWLETGHVKKWWDPEISWTPSAIEAKYTPYTKGYTLINNVKKAIKAFIVYIKEHPIGYIQYYNALDFFAPP